MAKLRTHHRSSVGKDLYATKDGQKIQTYKKLPIEARNSTCRRNFPFNKGHRRDVPHELEKHAGYVEDGKFDGLNNAPFWMRAAAAEIRRLREHIRAKELEEWQK